MTLQQLVPVVQTAVSPVILVSGVGLLLLSMTNRFTHLTDRSRQLAAELRHAAVENRGALAGQVAILGRRARVVRRAIALAATSVLTAAMLVIVLFLEALLAYDGPGLIAGLFIGCLALLIGSLLLFLEDVNLSLAAFELEVRHAEAASKESLAGISNAYTHPN